MGMVLVVMLEGEPQVRNGHARIWFGHEGNAIALHGLHDSAIPLLCGWHTGVVKGCRPVSSAKARVRRAK